MTARLATGALVLAGGRSTRMGAAKAGLEWHGSTLLRRAAGIAARAVDGPVVVVRARGQALPALPADIEITEDAHDGHGPLEAIAAGLAAVTGRADVVYVTSVDAPFLHPAFIRRVLALLGPDDDVALPHAGGFAQPLAAAYRVATVNAPLHALLTQDASPGSRALLRGLRVAEVTEAALRADPEVAVLDPALDSLRNLNDRAAYVVARARAAPAISLRDGTGETRTIHAATLAATGIAGGATINGRPARDPEEPLVAGDVVEPRRNS